VHSNHVYVSVIHGHDQGSLLLRTMDRALPTSVKVLYAEMPANRFSTGALEAVLDLWANKTIVACLLLIPEPVGSMPALTATKYKIPVLWLPSVQRVDQVSFYLFTVCSFRWHLISRIVYIVTMSEFEIPSDMVICARFGSLLYTFNTNNTHNFFYLSYRNTVINVDKI